MSSDLDSVAVALTTLWMATGELDVDSFVALMKEARTKDAAWPDGLVHALINLTVAALDTLALVDSTSEPVARQDRSPRVWLSVLALAGEDADAS